MVTMVKWILVTVLCSLCSGDPLGTPSKATVPLRICCGGEDCSADLKVLKELVTVRHGVEEVTIEIDAEFELSAGPLECNTEVMTVINLSGNRTFDVFQNGYLWVHGVPELYAPVFESGEFCLDQKSADEVVAKICYKNVCKEELCIHKCCREGFVLDLAIGCIQNDNQTFVLPSQYVNEENQVQLNISRSTPRINAGYLPRCDIEKGETFGVYDGEGSFSFLAGGGIYIPNDPVQNVFKSYCVDTFIIDALVERGAIICTTMYHVPPEKTIISHRILPILMQISSVFLLLTFVVYAILPELQSLHGKTVMCHVGAMWVHFVLMGVLNLSPIGTDHENKNWCIAVAVVTHFAFMSAFGWLGVMGFDICWTFRSVGGTRNRDKDSKKFFIYSLIAWGSAFVIAATGISADLAENGNPGILPKWFIRPGFGTWSCWFHTSTGLWTYLYGPLTAMLAFNMVMFGLTAPKIYEASKNVARLSPGDAALARERLHAIVKLFLLMGLTWITEAISFAIGGEAYYWIVSDVINICMPIFIFFLFVWKKKVFEMLATRYSIFRRILGRSLYRHPTTTSSGMTSLNTKSSMMRPSSNDEAAKMIVET